MKRSAILAAGMLSLIVAAGLPAVGAMAAPQMPGVLTQVAGAYRFQIGDAQVSALTDGTAPQDLHQLLRGITAPETDALLAHEMLSNPVQTSINVYLVEIGGRRILVDTGVGELFGPGSGGRLLGSLAAVGVRPDQIDDILITHVHPDHVGGLVVGGKVIFPKAVIHLGKPDLAYFVEPGSGLSHADAKSSDEAIKMLKPYIDAGKVTPFEKAGLILPGITAIPHPGHTPGSAFYVLESKGQKIAFVGDIVHAAAVQFPTPSVSIQYDASGPLAIGVRQEAFAAFAADGVLIAAPHLAFPGVGYVQVSGRGYRWIPVNYENWSKN